MKIKIIGLYLTVSLSACIFDNFDKRLNIVNGTNQVISAETYLDTIPTYPSVNLTAFYRRDTIAPRDTSARLETGGGSDGWRLFIQNSRNKKLNLIVYSLNSLAYYGHIDTLIKRRIYRRFEFDEAYLEKVDWVVTVK